jgi:uncharacterized membrane protein YccC
MTERLRGTARQVVALRPAPRSLPVALRAGVSVLVPLLAVVLTGHPGWSAYAAFGAFTSLYGRNSVGLSRMAMQASAGAALVGCVVAGVAVACLPGREPVAVVVAAAVAALGTALSRRQDWHPPGALFLVFAFGAVCSVPRSPGDVPVALAVAGGSAVFALLVGNALSVRRRADRAPRRPRTAAAVRPADLVAPAVAGLLAGVVATAAGGPHPYWATVAAAAPMSAVGTSHQAARAVQRVVGTLLGLLTAAAVLALGLGPVPAVLAVAALQVGAELLVGRNYALALLVITPLALLMGQVAAPRAAVPLLLDRGAETVVGAAVGLGVLLVVRLLRRPALAAAS